VSLVSLDLETHLIQPGLLAPPIVCGSVATRSVATHPTATVIGNLLTRKDALYTFEAALRSNAVIVGANIAYDMGCIAAARPDLLPLIFAKYERDEIHDVLIADSLDLIAQGKLVAGMRPSLADVTLRMLGRSNAKENDEYRLRYHELERVPMVDWPLSARQYPVDDAINTLEVAEAQLCTNANLCDLPAQCRAAFAEHLAAMWGLRTDGARVEKLEEQLKLEYAETMRAVEHLGIFRPPDRKGKRSKDMKVLAKLVSDAYLGDPPRTDKGGVRTDRTTLEDSGNTDLENFAKVSKLQKLIDTYLPFVKLGTKIPINISPNVLLANGRSSYDGLIQLLPRKGGIRDCFMARFGKVWCSVDYAAIEMNTLAEVCIAKVGYSKLADAINAGKDPHSLFVAEVYGVAYEFVIERVKAKDPLWVDRRQMMKAADFGYPGCMGAFKFAQTKRKEGLRLCLAARTATKCGEKMIRSWKGNEYPAPACEACVLQAEKLRLAFLAMWPEVKEYIAWIVQQMNVTDQLTQLHSDRVRGGLNVPSAANTLFSGLAGDGAKRALWRVSYECYCVPTSSLYGSRPVIFAHDEIMVEMAADKAPEAAARQTEIMIEEMQKVVPNVKVRAEPALMTHWYKDAATVHDAQGRLTVWQPKN
jgi:DNA polymerase I